MVVPAHVPQFALVLAMLGANLGCATTDGMQEKLREATSGYNRAVRWNDIDRAAGHLPAMSQVAFIAHHEEIGERLVIVDYELTRLDLDKESGIAGCRARISWHTDRRLIVETTTVDQAWQWHEGRFLLVDERRSSGAPLAIFAESDELSHPYLPGLDAYRHTYSIGEDPKPRRGRRRRQTAASPSTPEATRVEPGGPTDSQLSTSATPLSLQIRP